MARSGTYCTKQNKVKDCRQWPIHHQGATGIKQKQKFTSIHILNTNLKLRLHNLLLIQSKL